MAAATRKQADVTAEDADAAADSKAADTAASKTDDKDSDASSGTKYLNVTEGPVVIDKDGHQVDAGTWTDPVNLDAIGQHARSKGYLLPISAL